MPCKTCRYSKPTDDINPLDLTIWCYHHKRFCSGDQRCEDYAYNKLSQEVRCHGCGEIYLETTKKYDPERIANGTMFQLTEKYGPNGYNWSCFPNDEWIQAEALECPDCGAPICDLAGKVPEAALVNPYEGVVDTYTSKPWPQVSEIQEAGIIIPDYRKQEDSNGSKEGNEEKETVPTGTAGAEEGKEEKVVPPNDAHVCPVCGKVCATQFGLIGHMRSHK